MASSVGFQILSHAGLRIQAGGKELLCDPWLIGSCYWRSWWNYPPVPRDLVEDLAPDFIYLTHLHWDHFQAPSLRLFPADTPILVPFDRYERMRRDLRAVGMENIREIRHGERVELAQSLAVRSYHISPLVTDSALVIEAGDTILLNANDAKFLGAPLRQILRDYPRVDFCFRSHSSANPRSCFRIIDEPDAALDDNERYLRAFSLFMECVGPRYAIPFASNTCLLHDDVYHLNPLVQTPQSVSRYFEPFAADRKLPTKLQVMIPGDLWSADRGFVIQDQDWFEKRPEHLKRYRQRVAKTLDRQRKLENRVQVSLKQVQRFFTRVARDTPKLLLKPLRNREVLIVPQSARVTSAFAVNLWRGSVRIARPGEQFDLRIEVPTLICVQAMSMNMFGHAAISKRLRYFATREGLPALKRFLAILEMYECELLPLRRNFSLRTLRALLPRWREGLLYLKFLLQMRRGFDPPSVEERLLTDEVARRRRRPAAA